MGCHLVDRRPWNKMIYLLSVLLPWQLKLPLLLVVIEKFLYYRVACEWWLILIILYSGVRQASWCLLAKFHSAGSQEKGSVLLEKRETLQQPCRYILFIGRLGKRWPWVLARKLSRPPRGSPQNHFQGVLLNGPQRKRTMNWNPGDLNTRPITSYLCAREVYLPSVSSSIKWEERVVTLKVFFNSKSLSFWDPYCKNYEAASESPRKACSNRNYKSQWHKEDGSVFLSHVTI